MHEVVDCACSSFNANIAGSNLHLFRISDYLKELKLIIKTTQNAKILQLWIFFFFFVTFVKNSCFMVERLSNQPVAVFAVALPHFASLACLQGFHSHH